jgi:hypothetical protein
MMPIQTCQFEGKPGYKWGDSGKCYTYTKGSKSSEANALAKAQVQGRAVEASKNR